MSSAIVALAGTGLTIAAAADDRVSDHAIVTDAQAPITVWSVAKGANIDYKAFVEGLASARHVILGEVHDNLLHHAVRGRLIADLTKVRRTRNPGHRQPAAVFEHATTDRQSHLDVLNQALSGTAKRPTAEDFFDAVDWQHRGWPASKIFAPLINEVLTARMPLYAGDVPRSKIMAAMKAKDPLKDGGLTTEEATRLGLDRPLGAQNAKASLDEIARSHCGVMPASMFTSMAFAQRLRDATLADVMINASKIHGAAILLTGNGHARRDRGVPWYLHQRGGQHSVSVLIKEADDGVTRTGGDGDADFVIWTAPHQRPDPCVKLREKYGKTKR